MTTGAGKPPGGASGVTLAVVIATRDRAELLPQALDSALAQRRPADEILVVDDGSSDATPAVLARYEGRVVALRGEGAGPGRARNLAAERARSDYLVFLDDDDRLPLWALETWEAAIARGDGPAVAMGRPLAFRDPAELAVLERAPLELRAWPDMLASARARLPVSMAAAVRREALLAVGGFADERVGSEDQDLFLRLGDAAGFVFVEAPTVYLYRQSDGSMSRDPQRLHAGVRRLLARERAGAYGGAARRAERATVLARNVRYGASRLLHAGERRAASDLLARGLVHLARGRQLRRTVPIFRRALVAWLPGRRSRS